MFIIYSFTSDLVREDENCVILLVTFRVQYTIIYSSICGQNVCNKDLNFQNLRLHFFIYVCFIMCHHIEQYLEISKRLENTPVTNFVYNF